ncbi:MAG: TRAP transporter large permease subunit [Elioraea sp.]|nr:TRAP transporter large permease subunit [Elioraea sp.]
MDFELGLALVGLLVALVIAGFPIGLGLMLLAVLGVWLLRGDLAVAVRLIGSSVLTSTSEYVFSAIPLFVLMGALVSASGVGRDTFAVAQWMLRGLRGGLGVATVVANALFAAVTGVSVASASVFTQVAVPPMLQHGYHPRFAVGVVAGSSILGMLIPPSILMIVFGVLAEVSIGRLFLAGILPGLLMAAAFAAKILILARIRPGYVFEAGAKLEASADGLDTRAALGKLVPIVLLAGLVLGGIYGGVFTPTEAGAAGAAGALAVALLRRSLDRQSFWAVLIKTGQVAVGILFLLMAASVYSRMLTMAGIPAALAGWMQELGAGTYGFLAGHIAVMIALGMILDSVSILLIVVPIAVPIAKSLGIDLVHFGIVTIVAVEIGLLTPPFGLSVFAVRNALIGERIRLETVFAGALPFAAVMLAVLVLVVYFPGLSTWLAY